jgi:putative protease
MTERTRDQAVGVVRDYFRKIGVAALEVTKGSIKIGDTLRFAGHTTDFTQKVESMEVNHQTVVEAKPGDFVGIKVTDRVRENDLVFIEGSTEEEAL